jgi:putative MATE family efflux protein
MSNTAMKTFSNHKGNLVEGPIGAHLVRLSVPMIWGILAIISFQLVDTYYISRLGAAQLAAIGFTFPVTMTVFSLIIGMGIAMSSVLSRKIGGGNHHDVIRIATHGLILAALAAIILTVIGFAILNPLFHALGADEAMMPMIRDYMTIWLLGVIFIAIPIVGNSAIRATGDTLIPALSMISASVLNAIIGPFLIFGLAGFPRLEIRGAAIATLISYILAMSLSLYVLYARKKLIFREGLSLDRFGESAKQLLAIAIPAGIASLIQPFTQGVITAILASYSIHAVAAYGVVTRIEAMAFVIIMALATGMSPVLGQNMGAGKIERVRETLRLALLFCVGWSFFMAIILGIFAQHLAAVFSGNPEIIHYTALYFWIVPFSYAAGNLVQGWGAALNAIGRARQSAMMIIIKMIILQIPLALLCNKLWGAGAVFASIAAVNVATGLYYHFHHWKRLKAMAG